MPPVLDLVGVANQRGKREEGDKYVLLAQRRSAEMEGGADARRGLGETVPTRRRHDAGARPLPEQLV